MLLCFSSKHLSSKQLTPREGKQALVIYFFVSYDTLPCSSSAYTEKAYSGSIVKILST
jgi:hypothetical protein